MMLFSYTFRFFIKQILLLALLLVVPAFLSAQVKNEEQQDEVKIKADYQAMFCSATNGAILPSQKIKLIIQGPEHKKWFVSYSINNSPAVIVNGSKAIESSEYEFSLLLKNLSHKIQNYNIELKEAWLEDLTPLKIAKGFESANLQVLPLANPDFVDYYPKAKIKSVQNYSAEIGKNSSFVIDLPKNVELVKQDAKVLPDRQIVNFDIQWPANEGAELIKIIEQDAFGCNSDTVYAGVEIVKSFSVDVGQTQHICKGDTITLEAKTDLPSDYSFLWDNGNTEPSIQVSEPGTYQLTVTDLKDNQKVQASVDVQREEAPEINIEDRLVVGNNPVKLDIYDEDCTYLWDDGTTESYRYISKSGKYMVSKQSKYGCSSSKSFQAKLDSEIFKLELPSVIHMCGNEKMTLHPNLSIDQDYTYQWSTGARDSIIEIEKAGDYELTVTDPDGFSRTASSHVVYHPLPIVDLGSDLTLWDGDSIILDAKNPGASYVWNNGETSQKISAKSGGVYVVAVSDSYGCSNKDTVIIDYRNGKKFGVSLGENQSICLGDSVLVMAQLEGKPVAPLSYNWIGINHHAPEIYLKKSGEYCLEVTDANGNTEKGCISILAHKVPTVDLGQDLISYPKEKIVLDAGTPNCFYNWSTGEITQKIKISKEGKYWVAVTNEFNCTASDTIDIGLLDDYPYVGLPKAFSPNGDGHNDKLYVRGTGIKAATLLIYNRLGQKLFESKNIDTGWDGTYNGELQEIDVYIYILKVTYLDGKKFLKKGNVALLR